MMEPVINNETDVIARLERVQLEARDVRRRIEHATTPADRRSLNRQLAELEAQAAALRSLLG